MRNLRLTLLLVFAALVAPLEAQAQKPGAAPAKGPVASRPSPPVRHEVIILGASVSAGFVDPTSQRADGLANRSLRLDVALKKHWPRELARLRNYADLMMFLNAAGSGRRQVAKARKRKPALVLGIDLPIWFGYGRVRRGAAGEVEKGRLLLQDKGLALLAELAGLGCPVVVGDYPDMHGASRQMLPPHLIPNQATLKVLNERLRKFAAAHANVHVFPLASFVARAVGSTQKYVYGKDEVVFPKNYLLQSDRLHATRLGMLVLVHQLQAQLPAALGKTHPLVLHKTNFKQLVENAGAEDDLPEANKEP